MNLPLQFSKQRALHDTIVSNLAGSKKSTVIVVVSVIIAFVVLDAVTKAVPTVEVKVQPSSLHPIYGSVR